MSAGGNGHPEVEVFSPPYLFAGARPMISSAPAGVGYGQTFSVQTPDAASITAVTWIRLPSVTHAFDQNQRINRLSFIRGSGTLSVTAPNNANVTPPGHYMLFILNGQGVPSVATIVQIGGGAAPPPGGPVSMTVAYNGTLRDRVGQGNTALAADGALDATLTATLTGAAGRPVTRVRLQSSRQGFWDTSAGTVDWALGVAGTLDGPLLNDATTMAVNCSVAD